MKKINLKKIMATAVMLSVAFVNPANTYSNVNADTLKGYTIEGEIMPEVETVEEELAVENWMMDAEDIYAENTLRVEKWMFAADTYAEDALAVENWMLETESAAENELALENWMSETVVNSERELNIEGWMLAADDNTEEPLELEAWMF